MATPTKLSTASGCSPGCLVVFFAFFLCVGSVFLYMMALRPLAEMVGATDWVQTPCVIESIMLSHAKGNDSDNYQIDVVYRYEVAGQSHTGDRYSFFMVASNVTGWMRREVAALSAERQTVCYVNPDDPAESVLRSGLTPSAWWALFPLPFVAIGIGGIIFALRQRRKKSASVSRTLGERQATELTSPHDWLPKVQSVADAGDPMDPMDPRDPGGSRGSGGGGAMKLRSSSTPGKRTLGCLAVTLFWNGIVAVFVVGIVNEAMDGDTPWFPLLFISIFVIVGLLMVLGLIHSVMAMFNPRVTLTVARDSVALGGVLDVAWDVTGPVHRISRMEIWLEGVEKATYRQGTDTRTETSRFARLPIIDTQDAAEIVAGAGSVAVPADTMHSLEAANNKIAWSLHVRGHIARWPDVKEEYPIVVLPAEPAAIGATATGEGGMIP